MNTSLAYDIVQICAEVNEGVNLTLECDNVACRVLLPDSPEIPIGVPEGAARLGFQFPPETDALIMAALPALGVHSVSRNPK